MYWKVSPHNNSEYDEVIMPADSEEDHRSALNYAKDRLEDIWDRAEPDEAASVTITICSGNIEDDFDEEELFED